MTGPDRQSRYDWNLAGPGALLLVVGAALLVIGLATIRGFDIIGADLFAATFGWGTFLEALAAGGVAAAFRQIAEGFRQMAIEPIPSVASTWPYLAGGLACWTGGWLLLAGGIRPGEAVDAAPSEAAGSPLYPRLARYEDFRWGTLAAYGGGILGAELTLVFVHTLLVGRFLSPPAAFSVALLVAFAVAFFGGFIGASSARRLATPEATVAILYFGLPLPLLLSAMRFVPSLQLTFGHRLREIVYLSSLLGDSRPELGYWLTFFGLVLLLVLGINAGFVANSSGRLDLRSGFELFVASRHVSVFRPGLLLGTFAVLILGIIPPLIVYAILHAAGSAVERTRIKKLGLVDPLKAAEAQHRLKLKELKPTAMMTALSVGGVGVGVMALIIVLSVMSGFEVDLRQKILGTNAHAVVQKYDVGMPEYKDVIEKAKGVRGVVGATPFILNEVMISSEGNISGALIKGIDPATVGEVTDLPKYIQSGSLEALEHPEKIAPKRLSPSRGPALDDRPANPQPNKAQGRRPSGEGTAAGEGGGPVDDIIREVGDSIEDDPLIEMPEGDQGEPAALPGVLLGREMAASLRVVVGDRVNIVSPVSTELSPQGPIPKSRPFRVAGIFYSGMFEYDSKFIYIALTEAQKFFGVEGATGVELKVADVDDARRIGKAVSDRLEGYPYRVRDWGEMNKNLFSALRLEKLVMAIILSIIVIVAAGLIVATVIMLVLEKRKEISVLKALGVSDGGVVKIFLAEGLQIGLAGGLLGLFAGLAWCFFIEKVGIKLDPEVYYIPALPVRIEPVQTALSVVIAILVTFLASIYPALKASQVEPVEGLKAE